MKTIMELIICHLIGDYVLQSDYIARTKCENWYHMFVHCVLYIVPFWILYGFNLCLLFLFIEHFIHDVLKSRYDKLSYVEDQFSHYFAILIFYWWTIF